MQQSATVSNRPKHLGYTNDNIQTKNTGTNGMYVIACGLKEATVAMVAHPVVHFPGEETPRFRLRNNHFGVRKTNNNQLLSRNNGYVSPLSNIDACNFCW